MTGCKYIIFFFLLILSCAKNKDIQPERSKTFLITDKEFRQQYSYTDVYNFVKSYPKNQFTEDEIKYLVNAGKRGNVSQLLVLFIMQFESGLVANTQGTYKYKWRMSRAMGSSLGMSYVHNGKRVYPSSGFSAQIDNAIIILNNHFSDYYAGIEIELQKYHNIIYPDNAATYVLYKYKPFFESHEIFNWSLKPVGVVAGNDVYIKHFQNYKNKIEESRK
jgi:hypothetical protein